MALFAMAYYEDVIIIVLRVKLLGLLLNGSAHGKSEWAGLTYID